MAGGVIHGGEHADDREAAHEAGLERAHRAERVGYVVILAERKLFRVGLVHVVAEFRVGLFPPPQAN